MQQCGDKGIIWQIDHLPTTQPTWVWSPESSITLQVLPRVVPECTDRNKLWASLFVAEKLKNFKSNYIFSLWSSSFVWGKVSLNVPSLLLLPDSHKIEITTQATVLTSPNVQKKLNLQLHNLEMLLYDQHFNPKCSLTQRQDKQGSEVWGLIETLTREENYREQGGT